MVGVLFTVSASVIVLDVADSLRRIQKTAEKKNIKNAFIYPSQSRVGPERNSFRLEERKVSGLGLGFNVADGIHEFQLQAPWA